MKKIFYLNLFLLITISCQSKSRNCSKFHTGKFLYEDKASGQTIIQRTEKEQIETTDNLGAKVIYEIVWTSECEYELKPKKILKGELSENAGLVKVEIIETNGNQFRFRARTSASDFVLESEMVKLK